VGAHRDDVKVQQIRDAAKTLFLQRGFAGVSTAQLARAAGVSKETLYSRYPSKEAVLGDVLEHLISSGGVKSRAVPEVRTEAELRAALQGFARALVGELMRREYIELARIVITETPRLPRIGRVFREAVPERGLAGVRALLAAARRGGLVRDIDDATAARMFVGPLVIHALLNVLLVAPTEDTGTPDAPDVDALVELFLTAVSASEKEH
jgi:TetR/AcrR family transcriptional regulator, mexJK operon transcriptional repressor